MLTKAQASEALLEVLTSKEIHQHVASGTVTKDMAERGSKMTDAVRTIGEHEGKYMKTVGRSALPANSGVPMDSNFGSGHPEAHESVLNSQLFVMSQMSATISMNDMVQKVTSSSKRSVAANYIEQEVKANLTAIGKRENFFLLRGNASGCLAKVPSSGNNWDDTAQTLKVDDIRPFRKGMRLILRKTAAGSVVSYQGNSRYRGDLLSDWPTESGLPMEVKVTAVAKSTSLLTVKTKNDAALKDSGGSAIGATELNGFGVFLYDSQGMAPWGFANFAGEGNPANMGYDHTATPSGLNTLDLQIQHLFGGINRLSDDNEWWRGNEVGATELFTGAGTYPSLQHWNAQLDLIDERTEGDHGNVLSPVRTEMFNAVLSDMLRQNHTNITKQLPDGFGGYYDAIQWRFGYMVKDYDADPSLWPCIEMDQLYRLDAEEWGIDDTSNTYNRRRNAWGRGLQEFDVYMNWKGQWFSARNLGHLMGSGYSTTS